LSKGTPGAVPDIDNVVSHFVCVSMNHQNQLEQMANEVIFAKGFSNAFGSWC
jgi:hypothetical protein